MKYLKYLLRHKWYVYQAGRKLGLGFWQLLIHDLSKFHPREWKPYRRFFYPRFPEEKNQQAFDRAWLWHQNLNPHHWQFWILIRDTGEITPLEMPRHYTLEMIADWMGASRAIVGPTSNTKEWYQKNKERMILHPQTRQLVEEILNAD